MGKKRELVHWGRPARQKEGSQRESKPHSRKEMPQAGENYETMRGRGVAHKGSGSSPRGSAGVAVGGGGWRAKTTVVAGQTDERARNDPNVV